MSKVPKTSSYHGTYHVLGGLVSPIDGIGGWVPSMRVRRAAALSCTNSAENKLEMINILKEEGHELQTLGENIL